MLPYLSHIKSQNIKTTNEIKSYLPFRECCDFVAIPSGYMCKSNSTSCVYDVIIHDGLASNCIQDNLSSDY